MSEVGTQDSQKSTPVPDSESALFGTRDTAPSEDETRRGSLGAVEALRKIRRENNTVKYNMNLGF